MSSRIIFKCCNPPIPARVHRYCHEQPSVGLDRRLCTLQRTRPGQPTTSRAQRSGQTKTLMTGRARKAIEQQGHSLFLTRLFSGLDVGPTASPRKSIGRSAFITQSTTPVRMFTRSSTRANPIPESQTGAWAPTPTPPHGQPATLSTSSEASSWHFPQSTTHSGPGLRLGRLGPLPLPIALRAFRPLPPSIPTPASTLKGGPSPQLAFPPPPAILGSQPMLYLARRFPILAEQELMAIPQKSALDYSSFLIGAMETSYPSPTTLRAVIRQFRNFLKDSTKRRQSSAQHSQQPLLELPRARIWAQMIRGLIWLKEYRMARVAVHAMQKLSIKPTGYAWRGICRGWIEQGQLDRAEALAAKVLTNPSISHDYTLEERPYYFSDMQASLSPLESPNSATSASSNVRRRHRSPMSPNSAPMFLVIEALAECGEMERARQRFDQIPEHEMTDRLTSDMVAGYLRVGQQDKAQEVIRIMARCGVKPTAIVFNPIVEHAVQHMGMEAAEDLVRDMLNLGIYLNLFTYKILIRGYIASGQKDKAMECIERIRASGIETDRALGRMVLEGFWDMGESRTGDHGPPAVCAVNRPLKSADTLALDDLGFVSQAGWNSRCVEWIRAQKIEQAEEALHQVMSSQGPTLEVLEVVQALIDENEMTRAGYWFSRLLDPQVLAQYRSQESDQDDSRLVKLANRMVGGFIRTHEPQKAEAVIGAMSRQGIQPTVETINMILSWSTLQADMKDAEVLVSQMDRAGMAPNQETYEILCRGYALRGETDALKGCLTRMGEAGFDEQSHSQPLSELRELLLGQQCGDSSTVVSYGNTLQALCQRWVDQDQMSRAEYFVERLLDNPHVQPSKIPFKTLVQGWIDKSQRYPNLPSATILSGKKSMEEGSSPAPKAAPLGATSSSVPASESLEQERRQRQESVSKMKRARSWFDRIPEQDLDLDILNRMIGGYMTLGLENESEDLIQWMASKRIKPDVKTYNHILEHTVQHLSMPTAEALVRKMETKAGIAPDADTWNLLIRGYVIRGQLKKALQCLDRMTGQEAAVSPRVSAAKARSKRAAGLYDPELQELVEQDTLEPEADETVAASSPTFQFPPKKNVVEPNEMTEQLILSGFGVEKKPLQGQGDYVRALELYHNRIGRQRQQEEQLLKSVAGQGKGRLEGEEEEEWVLENLDRWEGLGGSDMVVGMTDADWKNELEWEELMEVEAGREREQSGGKRGRRGSL